MDLAILMDSWEIECCQPPPAVGDVGSWRLRWVDAPDGPGQRTARWRTTVVSPAADDEPAGLLLAEAGVTAWWPSPDVATVPTTGALVAQAHAGVPVEVPPVAGTVLAVHVVQRRYVRTPAGYVPARGEHTVRAVERSPRWFDHGPVRGPLATKPEPDSFLAETGVLFSVRLAG